MLYLEALRENCLIWQYLNDIYTITEIINDILRDLNRHPHYK